MQESNLFDEMKKWLGIKDSLKLFNRTTRGIYSTVPIEKNNIIIRIKSKYLLEYQKINKLYPIDGIEQVNSIVSFHLTKLYFEQDEFWSRYIDLLPSDVSEFIMFWNPQDFDMIQRTSLKNDIDTHIESIENDFDLISLFNQKHKIIPNQISKEEFYQTWLRFRLLVGSRIFGYNKQGVETSGLIPYIDMINHSVKPNATWYFDNSSDTFVLVSAEQIIAGEEIVDNYGVTNNQELLLYYGFTIVQNPNPIIKLCLEDTNYQFDLTSSTNTIVSEDEKKNIIDKLGQIYQHHNKMIPKIKNPNILNIYLDEISVIEHLLKDLFIFQYKKNDKIYEKTSITNMMKIK